MTNPSVNRTPQLYARVAGVLYLLNILAGLYGELFVRGKLIVAGNAAATAHNIIASESLFRRGIAGDLFMQVTDVPLIVIFYLFLRPVNKDLALLAAVFNIVQTSVLALNKLCLVATLSLLGDASYLQAVEPSQREALASLSLSLHESGFAIGLIFFGFSCLIGGYLMYRSGYFPRTIGVLQFVAGLCYLINSFALFLAPSFAEKLFPGILLPAFVGELATCLWLMVKGINVAKWNAQTA